MTKKTPKMISPLVSFVWFQALLDSKFVVSLPQVVNTCCRLRLLIACPGEDQHAALGGVLQLILELIHSLEMAALFVELDVVVL